MSSGPFVLKEWRRGAYVFLEKNEHFFGRGQEIAGYHLGPHIDGIIFKFFGTSDAAVLALMKGSVDMFWWGLQQGYLADLGDHDSGMAQNAGYSCHRQTHAPGFTHSTGENPP